VTWSNNIIIAVLITFSSGPLFAQAKAQVKAKESDEILLEDSSIDTAKKLKKYGRAEEVVNAIQRDPFYRLLEGLSDKEHPITDYELSEFTLLGTIWDIAKPMAMFKGPGERRYVVRVGDRIGRNNGIVTNVDKGEVLVKEIYTDINKNKIEKSTIKRVGKPV